MKPVRYKLTKSESNSFNAFAEERVMAAKAISPKPHFSAQQEDHLRACFFNCISDAYCAGMATGSRSKKPDALGSRQILDDLKMMIDDDKKHSKYLRVIADRLRILAKAYARSRRKK